ncbi:MAG: amidohydrolase family protein [Promethearchaeota archaeon]
MEDIELRNQMQMFRRRIISIFVVAITIIGWIQYKNINDLVGFWIFLILSMLFITLIGILPVLGAVLLIDYGFSFIKSELIGIISISNNFLIELWVRLLLFFGFMLQIYINIKLIIIILGLLGTGKNNPRRLCKFHDYALINCNILVGNKNSSIINDGAILVENIRQKNKHSNKVKGEFIGIIKAVGKRSEITIPKTYNQIDLKGAYVLPGLINAHAHLAGSGKPSRIFKLNDEIMEKFVFLLNSKFATKFLFKIMKKHAFNALNAGVTTIRCLGDPSFLDVKLRDKIIRNKILGPRLVVAGKSICATGGHGSLFGYIADSATELRKHIRYNIRKGVDLIKLISTGGVMDARQVGEAGRPQMTVEEIEAAAFEAHRANIKVSAHCESTKGIEEALMAGVDTIEHGAPLSQKAIELFKNNPKSLEGYSAFIPTISAGMGLATLPMNSTKITPMSFENAKLIHRGSIEGLIQAYENGIKLGIGNDASVPFNTHYNIWKEIKYVMNYTGMSAIEAIYYGTLGNAEILGIDDITGSIEPNKSADMIVVSRDPIDDIDALSDIKHVIIRGMFLKKPKVKKIKLIEKLEIKPISIKDFKKLQLWLL